MNDIAPHTFSKSFNNSVVAAETVLGPKALEKILRVAFSDISPGIVQATIDFIDPKKKVIVSTDVAGKVQVHDRIGYMSVDGLEGYTLVALKTAIAAAIHEDLTGFVLQALQLKWERELTLEDAENITFHLNRLIQLIK